MSTIGYRISGVSAALGALSNVLRNKHASNNLNGNVYEALVLVLVLSTGYFALWV